LPGGAALLVLLGLLLLRPLRELPGDGAYAQDDQDDDNLE
jgi:hypothetical protein